MPVVDTWHKTVKRPDGSKVVEESASYGRGKRWAARYRDDNGDQKSPKFATKAAAAAHLKRVEGDLSRGKYVDPAAGKATFKTYAEGWRSSARHRESTRERVERTLRRHVYPTFAARQMGTIKRTQIQAWVNGLEDKLSPSTITVAYSVVSTIFKAAVLDDVIGRTPCRDISLPSTGKPKKPVMPVEQVAALRQGLPPRYQAVVDLTAGSGLRQAEVFGLEVRHVDFLRRTLTVEQQLANETDYTPYLAPPKSDASYREIPLAQATVDALAAHLADFPAAVVEVEDRTDPKHVRAREVKLMFSTEDGLPMRRATWSQLLAPVMRTLGMPKGSGLHSVRRFYASLLIRYHESVKTVQERLGHTSAAVTLDTYAGLWPDSEDRTREAVEAGLSAGFFAVRPMCATAGE